MSYRVPNYSGLFIDDVDHTQPVTVEVQHTQYQSSPPVYHQQVPYQQQRPVQQVPLQQQQRSVRPHSASSAVSDYNNRELTSPVTTVTTTEETYRWVTTDCHIKCHRLSLWPRKILLSPPWKVSCCKIVWSKCFSDQIKPRALWWNMKFYPHNVEVLNTPPVPSQILIYDMYVHGNLLWFYQHGSFAELNNDHLWNSQRILAVTHSMISVSAPVTVLLIWKHYIFIAVTFLVCIDPSMIGIFAFQYDHQALPNYSFAKLSSAICDFFCFYKKQAAQWPREVRFQWNDRFYDELF